MTVAAVAGQTSAQAPGEAQAPRTPEVAALTRFVEEQRALLEMQGRVIEELKKRLEATTRVASATEARVSEIERQRDVAGNVAGAVADRLQVVEQSVQRLPELASQSETTGDFPESFRVPGTDASIRFGGQVRTLLVRNMGALGTDDRFVTSSIPVEGTTDAGRESRTTISASPSRLETDLRTPTPYGSLRAFVSGDFAGERRTYRLRHAFGQWRGLTVGQTWSTFSDPEAEPDGIDFEGLNAISLFRQPIIRWTKPLTERLEFAAAVENPSPDITGAAGVNQVPDVILRLRFDVKETRGRGLLVRGGGHTQAALLIRQIRGESPDRLNETVSTGGIGVHVSGRVPAPWRRNTDYIKFASAAGTGIGRYITDLGTLGGQDAIYDPVTHTLMALPVFSSYVGYEHWWTERIRSTGTFGLVFVDNVAEQAPDALHRTSRVSFNVAWSPIPRVDLIAELLAGRRTNKDGGDGTAGQLQVGWIFRF